MFLIPYTKARYRQLNQIRWYPVNTIWHKGVAFIARSFIDRLALTQNSWKHTNTLRIAEKHGIISKFAHSENI
jgi:hypothetical protein